ncbi:MAG: hypothetical protein V7749_08620 [Cocleimonas sp.]
MAEEVEDILVQELDTTLNVDDVPMTVSELHEALQTADAVCPSGNTPGDRLFKTYFR